MALAGLVIGVVMCGRPPGVGILWEYRCLPIYNLLQNAWKSAFLAPLSYLLMRKQEQEKHAGGHHDNQHDKTQKHLCRPMNPQPVGPDGDKGRHSRVNKNKHPDELRIFQ